MGVTWEGNQMRYPHIIEISHSLMLMTSIHLERHPRETTQSIRTRCNVRDKDLV